MCSYLVSLPFFGAFIVCTLQGNIISNSDPNPDIRFTSKDWGYLFLLFVLLTVIRFFLFGSFYPIYSRMGLKSCWQEMVFQAYGGLRGAVGISLAIAVNSIVRKATSEENLDPKFGEFLQINAQC